MPFFVSVEWHTFIRPDHLLESSHSQVVRCHGYVAMGALPLVRAIGTFQWARCHGYVAMGTLPLVRHRPYVAVGTLLLERCHSYVRIGTMPLLVHPHTWNLHTVQWYTAISCAEVGKPTLWKECGDQLH